MCYKAPKNLHHKRKKDTKAVNKLLAMAAKPLTPTGGSTAVPHGSTAPEVWRHRSMWWQHRGARPIAAPATPGSSCVPLTPSTGEAEKMRWRAEAGAAKVDARVRTRMRWDGVLDGGGAGKIWRSWACMAATRDTTKQRKCSGGKTQAAAQERGNGTVEISRDNYGVDQNERI